MDTIRVPRLETILSDMPGIKVPYDSVGGEFNEFIDRIFSALSGPERSDVHKMLLREKNRNGMLPLCLSLKIIEARNFIRYGLKEKVRIDIINPVYMDIGRMMAPSSENPNGENSLVEKIKLFQELEKISSGNLEIFVWVVDDACPRGSGRFAEDVLKEHFPAEFMSKYKVLFLEDAIRKGEYPAKDLPQGSIKGGAIHYGMRSVLREPRDERRRFIFDTDSDLSVHPQLIGLLLKEALLFDAVAVVGSRRQYDSIASIEKKRDMRGRFYIAIIQRLLPSIPENNIFDTNRGFKLYSLAAARTIVGGQKLFGFSYQVESILTLINKFPSHVVPRGICYIDSQYYSTSTRATSYYRSILDVINLSDVFVSSGHERELKKLLSALGCSGWAKVDKSIPSSIVSVPID